MHKVLYGNGISENLLHYKLSLMKEILYQASVEKCCGLVLFHSASPLPQIVCLDMFFFHVQVFLLALHLFLHRFISIS